MRLYLRAASTHFLPSNTLWLQGFSTYTSLPAWQAQIVMRECQWFGVAMEIASTSLFSMSFRTSWYFRTLSRFRARRSRTSRSTSHNAVRRTPLILLNSSMCEPPRPLRPTTATRTLSLAPTTCDHERGDRLPAVAAARDVFRKFRREMVFIGQCVFTAWAGWRRASFLCAARTLPIRVRPLAGPLKLRPRDGRPTRQPSRQPRLRKQHHQCGHDQPSPQFLFVLQFGIVEAPPLLDWLREFHFARFQRHAQAHQFFGGQRRRPALSRVQVDREPKRRLRGCDRVDAGQIGLLEAGLAGGELNLRAIRLPDGPGPIGTVRRQRHCIAHLVLGQSLIDAARLFQD